MKVKSESDATQSCPILRDPMDCSPPGSSVHGIFQSRVLEWGAIAFSKNVLYPLLNLESYSFKEDGRHLFLFLTDTSLSADPALARYVLIRLE